MQAVILGGGGGTRLRPITYEIPKSLLPVKRRPILNHELDFLWAAGVRVCAIIVHESDLPTFKRWQRTWDDAPWASAIEFRAEKERLGTFGALCTVRNWIKDKTFILSNGDSLMSFSIEHLLRVHKETSAKITTALVRVAQPLEYGAAIIDENTIIRFTKDAHEAHSGFISAGFYAVQSELLDDLIPHKVQSLERDILPLLASKKCYTGAIMETSRFYDCGTLDRWEQAMREW